MPTTQAFLFVDGTRIESPKSNVVQEIVVEQHVHLPDMFTIRLTDSNLLEFLDKGLLDLTKTVEVRVNTEEEVVHTLMKGEITSLEPAFDEGMNAELIVRGYDQSHRMFRETHSRAFLNIKDSDLASQFAGEAGLSPSVDTTSTVYEHLYQDNQSNLAYLTHRAWRIGYECYVEDKTLYFRKPKMEGNVKLTWGDNLLSFYPRVTLAEQVDEVFVRGWDVAEQAPIVGRASGNSGNLYPGIPEKKGPQWASKFGTGKFVVVDQPVVSQAEADILAQARLDEFSGSYIQAEGTAFRCPEIRAGKIVNIKALGERLSGDYLVTSARHVYTEKGLHTHFSVRGAKTGTLAEELAPEQKIHRWPGVVIGKVTNVDDPDKWGRVKLKFPWMSDDAESDWARVASAGGGQEAGLYAIPHIEDEVLVAFEYGDINQPFVLGGLWSSPIKIPPDAGTGGEQPKTRIWQTVAGHKISMFDNAEDKIELVTKGGHALTISDKEKKISIISTGGNKIIIDDNSNTITVESNQTVEVKAASDVTVTAGTSMEFQAGTNIEMKAGSGIKLTAGGKVEAQAGATADITGAAGVNVKGAMINLN